MTLNEIKPGDRFMLLQVKASGEVGKRLADMEFVKGVNGSVLRIAHVGDPIEVLIMDYHVSIRKSEASEIEVERIVKP